MLKLVSEGAFILVIYSPIIEKFLSSCTVSLDSWKMENYPKSYLHVGKAKSYPFFQILVLNISFATELFLLCCRFPYDG